MDQIIGLLSTDLLWVAVGLVILQIALTNADKIGTILSGRRSVERITREVPDLLQRQRDLEEAGHGSLARLIGIHINGVIQPRTRKVFDKQLDREVKRYQSWWTKISTFVVFGVYAVLIFAFYYALLEVSSFILSDAKEQVSWSEGLTVLGIAVLYALGTVVLNRSYKKVLHHFQNRDTEDYKRAQKEWSADNNLKFASTEDEGNSDG